MLWWFCLMLVMCGFLSLRVWTLLGPLSVLFCFVQCVVWVRCVCFASWYQLCVLRCCEARSGGDSQPFERIHTHTLHS